MTVPVERNGEPTSTERILSNEPSRSNRFAIKLILGMGEHEAATKPCDPGCRKPREDRAARSISFTAAGPARRRLRLGTGPGRASRPRQAHNALAVEIDRLAVVRGAQVRQNVFDYVQGSRGVSLFPRGTVSERSTASRAVFTRASIERAMLVLASSWQAAVAYNAMASASSTPTI